jgi:multidrug efflux pump subunit AcrA (membrane-fusion protein)
VLKRKRTILIYVASIVFAVLGTIWATLHGNSSQFVEPNKTNRGELAAMSVQVATIQRGRLASELQLTGNFLPQRRTLIVSQVDGVIQSIPNSGPTIEAEIDGRKYSEKLSLNLGHTVQEGDVLVELDPIEYELQLAAAKARMAQAERQLEDLLAWRRPETIRRIKAMRDEAAARLERAQAEFNRAQSLVNQRAGAQQEYDQAVAELRFAEAGLERAEADVEEATAGPTQPEIEIARSLVAQAAAEVAIHEDRLKRTVIRAPYSGVITERYVYEGERVTMMPRVDLMELIDVSLLMVQVSVPERYVGLIKTGDWVQVEAVGQQASLPGMVILVNEKIDYETRSFRVRVGIENLDRKLKAGQFAKVSFPLDATDDSLLIPAEAVVFFGGRPLTFVYDAESETVEQRTLELGLRGGGQFEVRSGLSLGERVVVHDPGVLANGMKVTLDQFHRADQTLQTAGAD